jgi:hypothetical protein
VYAVLVVVVCINPRVTSRIKSRLQTARQLLRILPSGCRAMKLVTLRSQFGLLICLNRFHSLLQGMLGNALKKCRLLFTGKPGASLFSSA